MTRIRIGLRLASHQLAEEASVYRPIVVILTTTDWPLLPLSLHCQPSEVAL